jgi:hypothetical protein
MADINALYASLLAAGRSNQRIAHDLVVAFETVKKTRDRHPGQARCRQPDRDRGAGPAAGPRFPGTVPQPAR